MSNIKIFDNIKNICEDKGLSISALERKANIGNGTIHKWNESSPRLNKVMAVANALEIPLAELIGEETSE